MINIVFGCICVRYSYGKTVIKISVFSATLTVTGRLRRLSGSAVGHRPLTSLFRPRIGYIRRVFYLSLRLVTVADRSSRLAYRVHKRGCFTATFTFTIIETANLTVRFFVSEEIWTET